MHDLDDLLQLFQAAGANRVLDQTGLLGGAVLNGVNQGQGGLALGQIVAHVLAEFVHVALIVEHVVDQLESDAQMAAKSGERLRKVRFRAGSENSPGFRR